MDELFEPNNMRVFFEGMALNCMHCKVPIRNEEDAKKHGRNCPERNKKRKVSDASRTDTQTGGDVQGGGQAVPS